MWIGTKHGGLIVIDSNLNIEETFSAAKKNFPDNNVQALVPDPANNRMWVRTKQGELTVINSALNIEAILTPSNEILPSKATQAFYFDPKTNLTWAGMSSDIGLLIFRSRGSLPWIRLKEETKKILKEKKFLDKFDLKILFEGGSLIAPPLDLKYHLRLESENLDKTTDELGLEDVNFDKIVDEKYHQPGTGLGHAIFGHPTSLENKKYRLQLTIAGQGFKTYTQPAVKFDVQTSPVAKVTHVNDIALDKISGERFSSKNPLSIGCDRSPARSWRMNEPLSIAGHERTQGWKIWLPGVKVGFQP